MIHVNIANEKNLFRYRLGSNQGSGVPVSRDQTGTISILEGWSWPGLRGGRTWKKLVEIPGTKKGEPKPALSPSFRPNPGETMLNPTLNCKKSGKFGGTLGTFLLYCKNYQLLI